MASYLASESTELPSYTSPPVVETILGVQFERLPKFRNGHLGAFWQTLGVSDWPVVIDAPPLPPQMERFTNGLQWDAGLQFQLTQNPASRMQLKNRAGDRMVQLQNGRLHVNWLGRENANYPRYNSIRNDFSSLVEKFANFATERELGELSSNQWEVTYINHIPQGTVWNTVDDWKFFLPFQSVPTIPGLVTGESFTGEWHFVIPEQRGRLHVEWQHVMLAEEQEVIQLTFTARGPCETSDTNSLFDGLDLGRAVIVRTFRALMSSEANDFWGLNK